MKEYAPLLIALPLLLAGCDSRVNIDESEFKQPQQIKAEVVGSDQRLKGSYESQGGVFSSYAEGSVDGRSGRLSVQYKLAGQQHFTDIEVSRALYLHMKSEEKTTIPLNVKYFPCDVDELDDFRICYQLNFSFNGKLAKTSDDFEAYIYDLTVWEDGDKQYSYTSSQRVNGYLPAEVSEQLINKAIANAREEKDEDS